VPQRARTRCAFSSPDFFFRFAFCHHARCCFRDAFHYHYFIDPLFAATRAPRSVTPCLCRLPTAPLIADATPPDAAADGYSSPTPSLLIASSRVLHYFIRRCCRCAEPILCWRAAPADFTSSLPPLRLRFHYYRHYQARLLFSITISMLLDGDYHRHFSPPFSSLFYVA